MKTNKYMSAAVLIMCTLSCGKLLDEMPDNRTELDSESKITKILVSAYPASDFMLAAEMMSDNVDDFGPTNPYTDNFIDQVFAWEDVTESNNESPERIWESSYLAIAAANQALEAIEGLGGATTETLRHAKAEALLCRAYNHFVLVNMFCLNYNASTSDTDPGIPYSDTPETELAPEYERGTVAEVYEKINADIEEALPLQADTYYTVPKYHFNRKAAYAFAARFNLFYEKWDKAEAYADKCLGSAPGILLRDWKGLSEMTQEATAITKQFIRSDQNCNLLLMTAYSVMGLSFGPYYYYSKYSHGSYLSGTEDGMADNIWGEDSFYMGMKVYKGTNLDKTLFWKLPYLFEYTDAVAGIGYYRTVYPAFWADETLLVRAESRILQGKYDRAAEDLTTWMQNIVDTDLILTRASIKRFYNNIDYGTWSSPTIKKHLEPGFDIGHERGDKEAMLQCLLEFRRIETLAQGLRWFDIKRYGIEIERRVMNSKGEPEGITDVLPADDPRRAVQIPLKVRRAGMEANPR